MELLVLVWRQYRWPFISVMALSLASAALGIGLIAFINQRLIETADTSLLVLPEFLGLLLLLMAVTLGSQLALTTLGHHFVYRLRSEFIKRILDTHVERIEQLGSASLLAGLTSDVRNITIAFVRLPELVQGIILTIGSAAYLWMLSGKMLLVTAIWMSITIWGGFVLVARSRAVIRRGVSGFRCRVLRKIIARRVWMRSCRRLLKRCATGRNRAE